MKMCADLSSVLCVILGWVWGYIYRQTGINSVRLIDDSERNGFIFLLPSFDSNTPDLIVPALMIAVVGFLETMAVGGKMANERRYNYDSNQELLALGAANVGGAFMGAFPITGGFSRTAVNSMFCASFPLAGALTSIVVVIAVYSLMPVVKLLPLAALAPLIIHGAIGVSDFKAFIPTFRGNTLDFLIMVATFVVSLGLTVKEGLITGAVHLEAHLRSGHAQLGSLWPGGGWDLQRCEVLPRRSDDPQMCCRSNGCCPELRKHQPLAGVLFARRGGCRQS